jgi:hypothetical protein
MLVKFSEIEQFLCKAIRLPTFATLVKKLLESLIFCWNIRQLFIQVSYTVVVLLGVLVPDELAMVAAEDNSGTIQLVFEDVLVATHLLTSTLPVATLKFNFSQKVSCNTVHFIELRVASTKGAVVRIFCKPVTFAICTNRFFTYFAF